MTFTEVQTQRDAVLGELRIKEAALMKQLWQSRPSKTMAPGDNDRNVEMYGRSAELQAEVDGLKREWETLSDWAAYLVAHHD